MVYHFFKNVKYIYESIIHDYQRPTAENHRTLSDEAPPKKDLVLRNKVGLSRCVEFIQQEPFCLLSSIRSAFL